jgi:hypothetical protein
MPNQIFKLNGQALVLGLIAAAYPVVSYTAPAARVDFAIGNVKAVKPNGEARTIGKGAQIEQGETIATNNGRAQLRFTDGAFVSLQPESEFRIDQYRFDGKQDGNEKGFFSLVKGGLRTITGLVGRSNKNNYQVTTSVATIGIRGTEYTIQYGQSIVGTVGEGEINVCNGAGCLSVTNGESYYVQNDAIKPVLTNKRTDLPPPPPENPPTEFVEGDSVDESGTPCSLTNTCVAQPQGTILTGKLTGVSMGIANGNLGGRVFLDTTVDLNGAGVLVSFEDTDFCGTFCANPLVNLQSPASSGNDGIIAWGTALGASGGECCLFNQNDPQHYVVGIPTNYGTLGNVQGTYSLLGATTPTGTSSGSAGGQLTSMTMTANFGTGSIDGNMTWMFGAVKIDGSFNGSADGPYFASGFTTAASGSGSGSLNMEGFFAGANAERAGFVYHMDNSMLPESYIGAAALKRDGDLTPAPNPQ